MTKQEHFAAIEKKAEKRREDESISAHAELFAQISVCETTSEYNRMRAFATLKLVPKRSLTSETRRRDAVRMVEDVLAGDIPNPSIMAVLRS